MRPLQRTWHYRERIPLRRISRSRRSSCKGTCRAHHTRLGRNAQHQRRDDDHGCACRRYGTGRGTQHLAGTPAITPSVASDYDVRRGTCSCAAPATASVRHRITRTEWPSKRGNAGHRRRRADGGRRAGHRPRPLPHRSGESEQPASQPPGSRPPGNGPALKQRIRTTKCAPTHTAMDRLNTRNSSTNTTAGSQITTKIVIVAQQSREPRT